MLAIGIAASLQMEGTNDVYLECECGLRISHFRKWPFLLFQKLSNPFRSHPKMVEER